MIKKYDITDKNDYLDVVKADWLRSHLSQDQYRITNIGFLIDHYTVEFLDPKAETFYLLRWV